MGFLAVCFFLLPENETKGRSFTNVLQVVYGRVKSKVTLHLVVAVYKMTCCITSKVTDFSSECSM